MSTSRGEATWPRPAQVVVLPGAVADSLRDDSNDSNDSNGSGDPVDSALALVAEFSPGLSPGSVLRCLARCRRRLVVAGGRWSAGAPAAGAATALAMARAELTDRCEQRSRTRP